MPTMKEFTKSVNLCARIIRFVASTIQQARHVQLEFLLINYDPAPKIQANTSSSCVFFCIFLGGPSVIPNLRFGGPG